MPIPAPVSNYELPTVQALARLTRLVATTFSLVASKKPALSLADSMSDSVSDEQKHQRYQDESDQLAHSRHGDDHSALLLLIG